MLHKGFRFVNQDSNACIPTRTLLRYSNIHSGHNAVSKLIRYSEIFSSVQGEGPMTGNPSIWLRLWGCTLTCRGFYQTDPTRPETYELPYDSIDMAKVTRLEDLPILAKGCDSAYSWDPRFLKLARKGTADELAVLMYNQLDVDLIQANRGKIDVVFTGGEPMMNQRNLIDVITELKKLDNNNRILSGDWVFETNCTVPLTPEFSDFIDETYALDMGHNNFIFSMSPKLFTVTGEKDVVDFNIIEDYAALSITGSSYLKLVIANKQECWDEFDRINERASQRDNVIPIYIMPVGATDAQQSSFDVAQICDEVNKRGLKFSGRLQAYVYQNMAGK